MFLNIAILLKFIEYVICIFVCLQCRGRCLPCSNMVESVVQKARPSVLFSECLGHEVLPKPKFTLIGVHINMGATKNFTLQHESGSILWHDTFFDEILACSKIYFEYGRILSKKEGRAEQCSVLELLLSIC